MPAVLRTSFALATTLCLAVPAIAQVAPARDRPGAQTPSPTGTAVITGTVTMAGTGQPARKARVMLSGTEIRGSRTAATDDQGRFLFTALPAGRYSLSASRPGHLTATYGARQPGRPGTQIQLSNGQKFEASLQVPRGSVITGMVLDENGEVSPQVPVRLMRVVTQNGQRTLQNSSSASTDDRGIYRVFGLLPGEYVVCATPRNNTMVQADQMMAELQGLRGALAGGGQTNPEQLRSIEARIAAIQGSMPQTDEGPPPGYAPVCYPGSLSAGSATPVPLGVGEERVGIDFQLQLAPLARVEGTVINSTGAQIRDISLNMSEINPLGQAMQNLNARADGEGRFRIPNVPPGQYRLTARANIGAAPAAGGGRGGPPAQRPEPVVVWASADVVVDGRNVANVMLTLQQGVSVSGQLAFEGATPAPTDLSRVRVTMSPVGPNPFGGGASGARVDANGRFTIQSVPPGRYRLSAGGPNGWVPESSMIGGQDALDFPFEVKGNQNISGAVVTFTDKQTELSGTVTNDRGQPAVEYTLVAFPVDQRYWVGSSRRIQTARPATDGRYTWRNLPPGEYRIAPALDIEPGMITDPAFLQQLETNSLRVTLQPGEKKVQDIRFGG